MAFFTFTFDSQILNKEADVLIAAPEKDFGTKCVYLLHGGGGGGGTDNKSWLGQKERLQEWAEKYRVTLIMPSAPDSFFANTAQGVRYEDYVTQELVPMLPMRFRLPQGRENTAVAGMSMGGYSALRLGLAAPEEFCKICCISAGNLWVSPLSNRVHAYALHPVFGVERIEDTKGTEHDLFVRAKRDIEQKKPLPEIFHACGKQDHALEHAHPTAEWFQSNAPEFTYHYFEPDIGRHDDAFWSEWLPKFLDFLQSGKC